MEDQATDRIYRIGQKKEVHVYCPLAIHPTIGEQSFDMVLDKLLQKKRKLSERVLWPPAGSPQDCDFLVDEAIWGKNGNANKLTYSDIFAMEPLQFDEHIAHTFRRTLQAQGLRVERTIQSHDGGADITIKNNDGLVVGIIQCKHTGSKDKQTTACEDLRRSLTSYYVKEPWLIGATNATRFQATDYDWLRSYPKGILIAGEDILECESAINKIRA